jgi:hypothetical protein
VPDIIGAHGRHHREILPTLNATILDEMGDIIGNLPDIIAFCHCFLTPSMLICRYCQKALADSS